MEKKIESLLKLLDDENPQTAHVAMTELLKHEQDISVWLAHHQESDNPLMRKRIHQLQSIITLRRRRRNFAKLLSCKDLSLVNGLIEVHLQWYDNDSARGLLELWDELFAAARRYNPENIEKLAYFMRKCGFTVAPQGEIQADYYCIGPVLEDLVGADFILCAVAREIAARWKLELKIIRLMNDFALVDGQGRVLAPKNDWQTLPDIQLGGCQFWDSEKILKLDSTMLFLYAVGSDSFRYVHTIGNSLASFVDEETPDFLPFPYAPDDSDNNAGD